MPRGYNRHMSSYDNIRRQYKPDRIKWLLIAESPPPGAEVASSRHFYRSDQVRTADRLFVNTVKALYEDAAELSEAQIEPNKEAWLRRLQQDGVYMMEALEVSQHHEVTSTERRAKITAVLPRLIERVREVAEADTQIILIKSNVFVVAAEPLRQAGFSVLNTVLVDYPGQFTQNRYRDKLSDLMRAHGWRNQPPKA
jgi:hypothetical protein